MQPLPGSRRRPGDLGGLRAGSFVTRPVTGAFWLPALALLAGCASPREPSTTAPPHVSVHPDGWTEPAASDFHGAFLAGVDYVMDECRECHGNTFRGGIVGVSCRTCHTGPDGPEACNTCHGDFDGDGHDLLSAAPPSALDGSQESPSVGAHAFHLGYDPSRPAEETCADCHVVPEEVGTDDHLGPDHRAEIPFPGLRASLVTQGGERVPVPAWDPVTRTCSNTYCHGNWGLREVDSANGFMYLEPTMRGNGVDPVWHDPSTAECGSCHDNPPAGHEPRTIDECADCHEAVVDGAGNIIDRSKHVDGMVQVFDEEFPMFRVDPNEGRQGTSPLPSRFRR